jgi:hypothetical protein
MFAAVDDHVVDIGGNTGKHRDDAGRANRRIGGGDNECRRDNSRPGDDGCHDAHHDAYHDARCYDRGGAGRGMGAGDSAE